MKKELTSSELSELKTKIATASSDILTSLANFNSLLYLLGQGNVGSGLITGTYENVFTALASMCETIYNNAVNLDEDIATVQQNENKAALSEHGTDMYDVRIVPLSTKELETDVLGNL